MKTLIAIVAALVSLSAAAAPPQPPSSSKVETWRTQTANGDILVIEDKPCIYAGKPMVGAGSAFKIAYKQFVEGCYAVKDGKVSYVLNDGDRDTLPVEQFRRVQ